MYDPVKNKNMHVFMQHSDETGFWSPAAVPTCDHIAQNYDR